jgi:alpha-ribazole phosphatase
MSESAGAGQLLVRGHALVAFRHAPVLLSGICYGRLDVEAKLSAGEAADVIESALGALRPGVVWSSPLSRCQGPAAELSRRLGVPHAIDARLIEIAYGRWEGRAWSDLERNDAKAYSAWLQGWQQIRAPGGEAAIDVEQRVRSWWRALSPAHSHILVAHGGVLRALRVITAGASWTDAMSTAVAYLRAERFPLPLGDIDLSGGMGASKV